MRKTILLPLAVLLVVVITAPSVRAFTFQVGENSGDMVDVGSFFAEYTVPVQVGDQVIQVDPNPNGLNPLPLQEPTWTGAAAGPTLGTFYDTWDLVGAEDRTLFQILGLWEPPGQSGVNQYYYGGAPGEPQLTGLTYDLVVTSVAKVGPGDYVVKLGPGGRYANAGYTGRIDIYEDTTTSADTRGTGGRPWDWVEGGASDAFPTYSDGSLVLSGRFLPIAADGTLFALNLDYDTDGDLDDTTDDGGEGVLWSVLGNGIIEVLVNNTSTPFEGTYLAADGTFGDITFNNRFDFFPDDDVTARLDSVDPTSGDIDDPNTPDTIWWATASYDPFNFTVIPEPTSMALLGLALVGMGMRRRRKKS